MNWQEVTFRSRSATLARYCFTECVKISASMKSPLNKKFVHFAFSLVLALFGPFILPPHVVGTYEPLVSLLLRSDVWTGEAEIAFYIIMGVEWVVYFFLIYCVSGFMRSRKDT